ncbi:MAG: autotransporter-associated beta strand repeat-containing protein [Phycisphaerae bacterium]
MAGAANFTWDAGGANPSDPVDGSGIWSATAANWSNGGSDSAWNSDSNDLGDQAIIGHGNGAAGTVALGENVIAGMLTMNAATSGEYTLAADGGYYLTIQGGQPDGNNLGEVRFLAGTFNIDARLYALFGFSSTGLDWSAIDQGATVNVNAELDLPGFSPAALGTAHYGTGLFELGMKTATTDTMNVNSGGYVRENGVFLAGWANGSTGIYNQNAGGKTLGWWFQLGGTGSLTSGGTGIGVLNLNGGVLNIGLIYSHNAAAGGSLYLNGGTLEEQGYPGGNYNDNKGRFIDSSVHVYVENGATLNVPGASPNALSQSPFLAVNGYSGGVTKTGSGVFEMSGTNTYTGATVIEDGTLQLASGASIADSAGLTIDSGSAFDPSANLTGPTSLNGLTISGGEIDFAMDGSGNISRLQINAAAHVNGVNYIGLNTGGTQLRIGVYNLISDPYGGLAGTFEFSNGATTEELSAGGTNYALALSNSTADEQLTITYYGDPIPEPVANNASGLSPIGERNPARLCRNQRRRLGSFQFSVSALGLRNEHWKLKTRQILAPRKEIAPLRYGARLGMGGNPTVVFKSTALDGGSSAWILAIHEAAGGGFHWSSYWWLYPSSPCL